MSSKITLKKLDTVVGHIISDFLKSKNRADIPLHLQHAGKPRTKSTRKKSCKPRKHKVKKAKKVKK